MTQLPGFQLPARSPSFSDEAGSGCKSRTGSWKLEAGSWNHVPLASRRLALMTEYTQSESLRKHMLAVEAAVRGYARLCGEDEEDWGVVALLHDFDYERWPDAGEPSVPRRRDPAGAGLSRVGDARDPVARRLLRRRRASRGWSTRCTPATRCPASSPPRRWCGRRRACSTSRPPSVVKRMKDKAFARAVSRDDLRRGAEELGLPLDEHITQRDRVHARAGRRARAARNAVTEPNSRPLISVSPQSSLSSPSRRTRPPRRKPPAGTDPVVQLDDVTVIYGNESGAQGRERRVSRAARSACSARTAPARARCSRRCSASSSRRQGAMTVLGLDVAAAAAGDPRAHRLHAGERRAHSRHERGVVRRLLRPARRACRRRRDAARARGAVLRRPRRGALPQRRDLLDRHEAAHQAGAGAGPRSRSAVPRRADQRHGPEGARRDARAHPRPRAQQGRQPDPVVAPAARRRVHLRPRRRDGQGAGRGAGADRRAEGAGGPRVRAARQGRPAAASSRCCGAPAWMPRDRRGRDARVRARAAERRRAATSAHLRLAARLRRAGAAPAAERADARGRLREGARRGVSEATSTPTSADMPIHDQSYRRYGGGRRRAGRRVDGHRARPASGRMLRKRAFLGLLLFAWGRSSSAPCRSTSPPTIPQAAFLGADGRDVPRVPRASRTSSSSSSRSTSAPG